MASSEQMRRDNVTQERAIVVEKDRVPKMASHFESLAEKTLGSDVPHEATITEVRHELPTHQFEAHVVRVGGLEFSSAAGETQVRRGVNTEEKSASRQHGVEGKDMHGMHGKFGQEEKSASTRHGVEEKDMHGMHGKFGHDKQGHTMEGIQKGRQQFVEKPGGVKFEVHGGGEQRGSIGEEGMKQHSHERNQEYGAKKGEETEKKQGISLEEISKQRQTAQQNSMEATRAAEEKYQKAKESGSQGLGNTTEYVKEKGGQTMEAVKQGLQTGTQFVAEKGQRGYQSTVETVVPAAQKTKEFVAEKGQQGYQSTKETLVPVAQKTKDFVAEKSVAAKDATVEGGKSATGYAGKVAGTVKDTAKVAGWGAAHFTLEKTAEATKAVANVAANVAGYAGEKAVQAKDVVAGAGQKVAHFTGEKIAVAKDMVVSTEESAAEYAARKKEEARREAEARKSAESKGEKVHGSGEGNQQGRREEQGQRISETMTTENRTTKRGQTPYQAGELVQDVTETVANAAGEVFQDATESIAKPAEVATKKVHGEGNEEHEGGGGGRGVTGVVLHAIGETIFEIGQTTKEMITGEGHQVKHEEEDGSKTKESLKSMRG